MSTCTGMFTCIQAWLGGTRCLRGRHVTMEIILRWKIRPFAQIFFVCDWTTLRDSVERLRVTESGRGRRSYWLIGKSEYGAPPRGPDIDDLKHEGEQILGCSVFPVS